MGIASAQFWKYYGASRLISENTHRWGTHHCTAGLQFYKVALDCFTKYFDQKVKQIPQTLRVRLLPKGVSVGGIY